TGFGLLARPRLEPIVGLLIPRACCNLVTARPSKRCYVLGKKERERPCPVIPVPLWSGKLQTARRMQTVRRYGPPIQLFGLRERLDPSTPANRRRRKDRMQRVRSPNRHLGRVEGASKTSDRPEHGFPTSGRDRDCGS